MNLTAILPALVALFAGVAAYESVFREGIDYLAIRGDDVARKTAARNAVRYVPASIAGVGVLLSMGLFGEMFHLVILGMTGMAAWDAYKQATEMFGSSVNAVTEKRATRRLKTSLPVAVSGYLLISGVGLWAFAPLAFTGIVAGRRMYARRQATGRLV